MEIDRSQCVTITYTNYRGETAERIILPQKIWFGKTEYHKAEQWLLDGFDLAKQAVRTFAVRDISKWD